MPLFKKWVVTAAAIVAFAGTNVAFGQTGATITVGHQSQPVQTPLLARSGIVAYERDGDSSAGLAVYTAGFMYCANVLDTQPDTAVSLLMNHEDQALTPAHAWSFSPTTDVSTFGYNGGRLQVNGNHPTTLTCLSTAVDGAVGSGLTEGIFANGVESATLENYTNLVNWVTPPGFDWTAPDWSQVPTDPCNPSRSQPAEIDEDVACVATTGVRNDVTHGGERAGTMWTTTDGVNFSYLFRVDARTGPQQPGAVAKFQIPSVNAVGDASALNVELVEAFDSGFLSQNGQYCFLAVLPNALGSSVCGTSGTPLNGPWSYLLPVQPPPVGPGASSFYVVIIRSIIGNHSLPTTPVAGVAALTDPVLMAEGADKFSGDNVIFGFVPAVGAGFPWMAGGQ